MAAFANNIFFKQYNHKHSVYVSAALHLHGQRIENLIDLKEANWKDENWEDYFIQEVFLP